MPLLNSKEVAVNISLDRTGTRYAQQDTLVNTDDLSRHLKTPGMFPLCNEIYTERLRPDSKCCTQQHVSLFLRNYWQGNDAAADKAIDQLVDGLDVKIDTNKLGTTLRFSGDDNMPTLCEKLKSTFFVVSSPNGDVTRPVVNAEMRGALEYGLTSYIDFEEIIKAANAAARTTTPAPVAA